MSCDVLTVVEGIKLLERNGYPRPRIPKEVQDLAAAYLEQLNQLPAECVAEAFQRFVREGEDTYFPKVKKIRSLALLVRRERPAQHAKDLQSRYLAWENRGWRDQQDGPMTACPVCDVIPQNVVSEKSLRATREPCALFRVPHDPQRHKEANVRALGG